MTTRSKSTEMVTSPSGQLLEVHVKGKLEREDYAVFVPAVERLLAEQGKINMLVCLDHFRGWTAGALWEDIKFDVKHFRHIKRLGIVGESKWEHGMAIFCRPFTTAKVRFFHPDKIEEARRWVEGSEETPPSPPSPSDAEIS